MFRIGEKRLGAMVLFTALIAIAALATRCRAEQTTQRAIQIGLVNANGT